jgi:hypothetical protein
MRRAGQGKNTESIFPLQVKNLRQFVRNDRSHDCVGRLTFEHQRVDQYDVTQLPTTQKLRAALIAVNMFIVTLTDGLIAAFLMNPGSPFTSGCFSPMI